MFGLGVTYFSKITNVEVCQVVEYAKIALNNLTIQNWICKNEVINLKNKTFQKSPYQRNLISNPIQQILLKKMIIFLLVIEFQRNFEIFLSNF